MNVLSLFDGMSCGMIALERAGIKVTNYYASEIDKYAQIVSEANYPDIIRMGDVTKWREWDIDWSSIDLIIAGSPCQGFSAAGKKAGTMAKIDGDLVVIETREQYLNAKRQGAEFLSQSFLFWEFVLLLDCAKMKNRKIRFFLENVEMSTKNKTMISESIGVTPVAINSSLVSAQNRPRLYWFNWVVNGSPSDLGLMLGDILDEGEFKWKSLAGKNAYLEGGYVQLDPANKGNKSQCNRVNIPKSKHKCLSGTQGGNKHGVVYFEKGVYRDLTLNELKRLQTVPDSFKFNVSKTQAQSLLGNGWTIDVIVHIFKSMNN